MSSVENRETRGERREARLEEQARAGNVPAILAWDRGRRYAAGEVCPRDLLPAAALRAARKIMGARKDRRHDKSIADAGRIGEPGRILTLAAAKRRDLAARAAALLEKRLLAGKHLAGAVIDRLAGRWANKVAPQADAVIRQIVQRIGRIGDQAAADLGRMATDETFGGKRGRHHALRRTTLHRVERLADWSAALVTLEDYVSFGSHRWGDGDRGYGKRCGSSYRCYLVVRDKSTREAHIIRVPPKFGNAGTQFFGTFASPRARIHAAVAWTFAREPADYAPAIEA